MPRKLIVRLKGGLGNQLFCYAAARRLALSNNAELVLDAVTGFKYDHLYRRNYALSSFRIPCRLATAGERMEPLERIRHYIAHKLSERKPLARRRYIRQVGVDFDHRILSLGLQSGTTYFDAFGQSERYFADIRELLEEDLMMVAPNDSKNIAMAGQIETTESVALHMRWFDSGDGGELSSNISLAYYAEAVSRLLSQTPVAHFFIFSDRPVEAATRLAPILRDHPFTLVAHNAVNRNAEADFWLMRQCRHFIIGNSTFAWWAAWLGERHRPETQVVAPSRNVNPDQSVTAWGFVGLLPDRWTIL